MHRFVLILSGLVACALLFVACAHTRPQADNPGGIDIVGESFPDLTPRATREMDHIEAARWVTLLDSYERRLDYQFENRSMDENQLFSLKARLLELVDQAMTHYRRFPKDLDLELRQIIARIDRAIISYRDPGAVQVVEIPTYDDEQAPSRRRPFQFVWPLTRLEVTSPFGYRRDPFTGKKAFHNGIDLAANTGTLLFASERGRVVFSGWRGRAGLVVIIDHLNGFKTVYAHLDRLLTTNGLWVERGQPIGTVGSTGRATGPHVHFMITLHDQELDPERYVGAILN